MTTRFLLAVIMAVAMALAPLAMPAGEAMAAAPASHHGEMTASDHCGDQQPQPDRPDQAGKDCCVAMCIAVVVPAGTAELPEYHAPGQRPASDLDRLGYLGEIATPPPRSV